MIIEFVGERGGSVFTDDQGPGYNYIFHGSKNGRKFLRCVYRPLPQHRRVRKVICYGRGSYKEGEEQLEDAKIKISATRQHTCLPDPLLPKVFEARRAVLEHACLNPTLPPKAIHSAVSQRYSVEVMARVQIDSLRRSINRKKHQNSPAKPKMFKHVTGQTLSNVSGNQTTGYREIPHIDHEYTTDLMNNEETDRHEHLKSRKNGQNAPQKKEEQILGSGGSIMMAPNQNFFREVRLEKTNVNLNERFKKVKVPIEDRNKIDIPVYADHTQIMFIHKHSLLVINSNKHLIEHIEGACLDQVAKLIRHKKILDCAVIVDPFRIYCIFETSTPMPNQISSVFEQIKNIAHENPQLRKFYYIYNKSQKGSGSLFAPKFLEPYFRNTIMEDLPEVKFRCYQFSQEELVSGGMQNQREVSFFSSMDIPKSEVKIIALGQELQNTQNQNNLQAAHAKPRRNERTMQISSEIKLEDQLVDDNSTWVLYINNQPE